VRKAALLLLATTLPAAAAPLPSRRSDIVEVVDKVSPAVVNIAAQQTVRRNRSLFDDFFFGLDSRPARSLGSGVIIDPKGIILTNDHVISGASKIIATTKDGRELECDVVGSDADNDLAVLKARGAVSNLPMLRLGSSSDLLIGETVIAIGNPFGLTNTVTAGVLSALGRTVPGENQRVYSDFLQIDAPINPGNSGGPVVNIQGELIGVATAIIGGAQGIGFAIPAERAKRIVSDLLRFGSVQPVWIGIHGRTIGGRDEGRPRGFRVRSVDPDSPADRAGIRADDQIVSIDEKPVDSREAFETALSTRGPGRAMRMVLKNNSGGTRTVTVSGQVPPADYGVRLLREDLGMTVREQRGRLRITIADEKGAAARAGLESGDLLLAINGTEVDAVEDINKVLQRDHSRTTLWMAVGRGGWQYTLTFPLN
jgi:serine protease Do